MERIREVLYGYETAGLIDCDPEKVLSYLAGDVVGVGMGEQGMVTSRRDIEDIMRNTLRQDPQATYRLEIEDIVIRLTSPFSASLCAKVYVKRSAGGQVAVSGFMQSLSLIYECGDWFICALHASPIMLSEESIESYPLTFADNTLAQLRSEIQGEAFELLNQSLSGGVLGFSLQEGYPVRFANDALLEMLGYTRQEFESALGSGFEQVVPEKERRRLQALRDACPAGSDFSARTQWVRRDGSRIWVEYRSRRIADERGDVYVLAVVLEVTELVELQEESRAQNRLIQDSIEYAAKIQRNLLPPNRALRSAFSDYSVLWEPRDVVGGDLYWMRQFPTGVLLCVCDCTGHGVPGAFLTMLAASTLDTQVDERTCQDTARIIWAMDRRFVEVLNVRSGPSEVMELRDGCDLAVLFVANDGTVTFSSSGIPLFVCDGVQAEQIKGQRLHVGEGRIRSQADVKAGRIAARPDQRFYLATDGLFAQIGGSDARPYGYRAFREALLDGHGQPLAAVSRQIWADFETYRGGAARRDDVTLVTFQP